MGGSISTSDDDNVVTFAVFLLVVAIVGGWNSRGFDTQLIVFAAFAGYFLVGSDANLLVDGLMAGDWLDLPLNGVDRSQDDRISNRRWHVCWLDYSDRKKPRERRKTPFDVEEAIAIQRGAEEQYKYHLATLAAPPTVLDIFTDTRKAMIVKSHAFSC
jgi:hypothetical protein